MRYLFVFFLTVVSSFYCATANAQSSEQERYVTIIGGYSPQSIIFLGKTPDSQSIYNYLGTGRKLKSQFAGMDTYITFGIFPFIEFVYPKRDEGNIKRTVTGFGLSPLGFDFQKRITLNTSLNTRVSSGIMVIDRTFPTDKGRKLNYSFDISLALQRFVFPKTSVSLGYRFHHISNAQTGRENPGLDSNFLFISLKRYTHGH